MRTQPQLQPGFRHDGFSLIEILVTISIISIIAAFAIPAAVGFLKSGDTEMNQSILNGMAAAADEYNIATKSSVDHRANRDAFGNNINLNVGAANDATLGYFVFTAGQVPSAAQAISLAAKEQLMLNGTPILNINDDIATGTLTLANIDELQLVDTWGNNIRYAVKVSHSDTFTSDDYLPAHPTPFFASPGPDELWGTHSTTTNEPDADAQDNVYSFDMN